ncbi:MAG: alpha/beta hydrolase [Lachnospiraceae bacterium]|jgi:monoterpene epsilon-lactone hydrolase|nr:alpha/beta hydrolase [Lachnospiraceae bacterium]
MAISKKNQGLLNLVKRVHGVVENVDIEKHRQSQDQLGALFGQNKAVVIKEVDIGGMYGEWLCVNRAHMKKYVILYCHGGGYSTGSSLYGRTLTTRLASCTSMDVLSFDYRLAPEHPYPAAIEDAMKTWNHLMMYGYGARDVILAGDSAGGNLALALTHRLKEEGRLLPRGIVLLSPWTDLTSSGKSHQAKEGIDPVLNAAYLQEAIGNYLGEDYPPELLREPAVSPLFGNFEGFPPTYIQVGDQEILQSDSELLYKKMSQAGVNVTLDVFKGMWHVFQMSPFKTATEAMDKNAEFIFSICR